MHQGSLLDLNSGAAAGEEISVSAMTKWLESLLPKLLRFGRLLLIAVIVLVVGRKLIRWLVKIIGAALERHDVDEGVRRFLMAVLNVIFHFILILMTAGILGWETSSLVALVGSTGLTLGLALQGSLSNFAGGVLILIMKPFRLGDYIIANGTAAGNEGTVAAIDLFYTRLLTIDNRMVVIPNGILSNSSIVNVTNESIRRLDLLISVEYSQDIKKVKDILYRLAMESQLVLKEEHEISVFVNSFEASAITMGLRVWVVTEDYWRLRWDLLEKIKETFDQEGIQIPFDQLDINIKNSTN